MQTLRELRKAKGVTMKELGDVVGVAESTISQYETGKRSPDFETLLKFGEYFDVSVDYLLTGEPQKEKAPAKAEAASDDAIKFALFGDAKDEITEDDMDDVRAFAQFVAERKRKKDEKSN